MIRVDVDQRAVALLVADIAEAGSGIEDRVVDVWEETAGPIILRQIRRNVPKDTHALERAQDYKINRRNLSIRFGPYKRSVNPKSGRPASGYHRYVHDGTSRMPPRPFITNAIKARTTPRGAVMRGLATAGVTPINRRIYFS